MGVMEKEEGKKEEGVKRVDVEGEGGREVRGGRRGKVRREGKGK